MVLPPVVDGMSDTSDIQVNVYSRHYELEYNVALIDSGSDSGGNGF